MILASMTRGLQHPLLRTAALILLSTVLLWAGVLVGSPAQSANLVATPASRTPAEAAARPLRIAPNCSSGCTRERQEDRSKPMRLAPNCSTCIRHHDEPSSRSDRAVAGTVLASWSQGRS
ncbi:MAG TPA: hypothetical protein VFP68_03055 [Burkholderiaceae bacterium]|nr:hypothetical protein [Burkholderiaceae bacterium]